MDKSNPIAAFVNFIVSSFVAHPIRAFFVIVFTGLTLWATALMPWAELNMVAYEGDKMPHTLRLLHISEGASELFKNFEFKKSPLVEFLDEKKAEGTYGDYVYGLAIALAMLFASLGIMVIGSADESEKTIFAADEKK